MVAAFALSTEHQRAPRAPRFPPLRGSVSSIASKARSAVPPTIVAMRSQCLSPRAQTAVQPSSSCRRSRLLGQSGLNKESPDSRRGELTNTGVGFICHAVQKSNRGRVRAPTNRPDRGICDIILDLETFLERVVSMSRPRDDGNRPRSSADATGVQQRARAHERTRCFWATCTNSGARTC